MRRSPSATPGTARLSAGALFSRFDGDSSGTISTDELGRVLGECGFAVDDATLNQLFQSCVSGMDEELDHEQFAAMLRALDAREAFER